MAISISYNTKQNPERYMLTYISITVYDHIPISLDQVMKSPIVGPISMEPRVEDQAAMAPHQGTGSLTEG